MNRAIHLAVLLALGGCAQPSDSDYQIAGSPGLRILDSGDPPPGDCTAVGPIRIPQRPIGIVTWGVGYGAKDFYQSLHDQMAQRQANLVIPNEGSDPLTSISTGKPFEAVAYACR